MTMSIDGTNGITFPNGTVQLVAAASGPFTVTYDSGNQTITAAGSLTLAHSLGKKPSLTQAFLKCLTAEYGYVAGNEQPISMNPSTSTAYGCSVVTDTTNLNVVFGSNSPTFAGVNRTNGNQTGFTNANWAVIFRAWA